MSTEIRHDGGSMYVRTSDTVYNRDEYRGVLIVQSDSDPHSGHDQAIWINIETPDNPYAPGVYVKLHKEDVIELAKYLHERITQS
jgi:hypothetical protein